MSHLNSASRTPRTMRHAVAMAALALTSMATFSSHAASDAWKTGRQGIDETYAAERADCLAGNTTQDQRSCLYEARSVRRDALAALNASTSMGASTQVAQPDYRANALLRCDAVPTDAQKDCSRRLGGEGRMLGSVADGIIVWELPAAAQVASTDSGAPTLADSPYSPAESMGQSAMSAGGGASVGSSTPTEGQSESLMIQDQDAVPSAAPTITPDTTAPLPLGDRAFREDTD